MGMPIPQSNTNKSHIGPGKIEASVSEDGFVMISALGTEGRCNWYKLTPIEAVGFAAAVCAYAQEALKDQ